MKNDEIEVYYITIGVEFSNIPMAEKIATFVNLGKETPTQVAKLLRKTFAENAENHGWVKGTKFLPSQLFWVIYDTKSSEKGFACSKNTPKKFQVE